jgi:hypothetical protein
VSLFSTLQLPLPLPGAQRHYRPSDTVTISQRLPFFLHHPRADKNALRIAQLRSLRFVPCLHSNLHLLTPSSTVPLTLSHPFTDFSSSPLLENRCPAVVRRLPASAYVQCHSTASSIPWRYRQHPQALDTACSSPCPPPVLLRPPFSIGFLSPRQSGWICMQSTGRLGEQEEKCGREDEGRRR